MAAVARLPVTMGQRLRHIVGDAFGASVVEYHMEKAIREVREKVAAPMSTFYDPMSLFMGREWMQRRNTALSQGDLRQMARNPIIGSIINTRVAQVASYCQPQVSAYEYGYKIVSDDPDASKDLERIKALRQWFYNAGMEGYGEKHLEVWARKFVRDSLVLDGAASEVVATRSGAPAYMIAVDAATIRFLKAYLNYAVPHKPNEPIYAQVVDDIITCQYTDQQLMYMIRHPQTEMSFVGYGMPELEILMRTVTTIINADRFNSGMLAQGGTNKGILVVKSDSAQKLEMDSFKRDFREAVRNASAFWRPPVLQVSKDADINWIALDRSNRDMEYGALFDFLVKQACGVFQITPDEINWQIGNQGARTNFESNQGPKIRASQIKGLKPILTSLANNLNTHVTKRLDARYRIQFVGLLEERKEDAEIRKTEVENYKTVNETRAEIGLGPVKGGDIILNQWFLANQQNPMAAPFDAKPDHVVRTSANDDGLIAIEEDLGDIPV
jgi:hypothetical protein